MQYEIASTEIFNKWYQGLKDRNAAKVIAKRLTRVASDNLGDIASVGGGVSEMRIFAGQGYRIYFTMRRGVVILLLCGGDKSSQTRDIKKAKEIMKSIDEV